VDSQRLTATTDYCHVIATAKKPKFPAINIHEKKSQSQQKRLQPIVFAEN
jgi:hypothetical protein